jgi:hypothetical protein
MSNVIKHSTIIISLLALCACSNYGPTALSDYQTHIDQSTDLYPEGYENAGSYADYPAAKQPVAVPESYHVSHYRAPVRPQDADKQWVSSQDATHYTIELADDEKPASVANTLLSVPKTDRGAEVRYQQGDKTFYKGVYGSYPSKEAAEQALNNLPNDVKAKAQVKDWGNIQSHLD